jgi:hypothetical protein
MLANIDRIHARDYVDILDDVGKQLCPLPAQKIQTRISTDARQVRICVADKDDGGRRL